MPSRKLAAVFVPFFLVVGGAAITDTAVAGEPASTAERLGILAESPPSFSDTDSDPQRERDDWTAFRGEANCAGMKVEVSFSFNEQQQTVRDFTLEDSCRDPADADGGRVTWKASSTISASKGKFAVREVSRVIGARTSVQIGDAFQASGRVAGRRANGTTNAHVSLECKSGRMLKNCRTWTATAASAMTASTN